MEVKRIKTRCAADILCRAAASVEPAARVKTQFFFNSLASASGCVLFVA